MSFGRASEKFPELLSPEFLAKMNMSDRLKLCEIDEVFVEACDRLTGKFECFHPDTLKNVTFDFHYVVDCVMKYKVPPHILRNGILPPLQGRVIINGRKFVGWKKKYWKTIFHVLST